MSGRENVWVGVKKNLTKNLLFRLSQHNLHNV
jgi:hypothetical protein